MANPQTDSIWTYPYGYCLECHTYAPFRHANGNLLQSIHNSVYLCRSLITRCLTMHTAKIYNAIRDKNFCLQSCVISNRSCAVYKMKDGLWLSQVPKALFCSWFWNCVWNYSYTCLHKSVVPSFAMAGQAAVDKQLMYTCIDIIN